MVRAVMCGVWITLTILVVQKTWQTIVDPLHHVLRNTSQIKAWKSAMSDRIALRRPCDDQRKPCLALIPIDDSLS